MKLSAHATRRAAAMPLLLAPLWAALALGACASNGANEPAEAIPAEPPAATTPAPDPTPPQAEAPPAPPTRVLTPEFTRITTSSGIVIEELAPGAGAPCLPDSIITVRYTASTLDGDVFDRIAPDDAPARYRLDELILGWRQGLPGLREGGVRRLIIPPELAFGDTPQLDPATRRVILPPNSTVVFDIELLAVE